MDLVGERKVRPERRRSLLLDRARVLARAVQDAGLALEVRSQL